MLTADDFIPHIGKRVVTRGQPVALTLVSVDPRPDPRGAELSRVPFTLIFSGPPDTLLPEGLHDTSFEDGPTVTIYIMPVRTLARDRQDYQAVFN